MYQFFENKSPYRYKVRAGVLPHLRGGILTGNYSFSGSEMQSPTIVVSISYTKARWSRLLERVASGETVVITKRGLPMAKLVPLTQPVTAAA